MTSKALDLFQSCYFVEGWERMQIQRRCGMQMRHGVRMSSWQARDDGSVTSQSVGAGAARHGQIGGRKAEWETENSSKISECDSSKRLLGV